MSEKKKKEKLNLTLKKNLKKKKIFKKKNKKKINNVNTFR